jgi:Domain of unknown function (DUF4082)
LRNTLNARGKSRHRWLLLPVAVAAVLAIASVTSIAAKGAISATTTSSLWSHNAAPAAAATANDPNGVDLGMRFQASAAGTVTGVAFYKDARNTGVHVGSLWTSSGGLLARVTFKNETSSGWQTALFSQPVAIAKGETYTVSYYAPDGEYSYTHNYFANPVQSGSLTAPASDNGAYAYGASPVFPDDTHQATNYWVDVLFSNGSTGSAPTPTASPTAPAGNTSYVAPGTAGYRGAMSALTVDSPANGHVPAGSGCQWNQTYKYLRCDSTDLTLDDVDIQGGLYWDGCGSLTVKDSVFDWYPSQTWPDVYDACTAPAASATITATDSTFETSPNVVKYTGGSDIGGITEYTGTVPMLITHSLIQGFSQGFDPGSDSVIKDNEIYVQDNVCHTGTICHGDGLFSQGGNHILYEGNYIVVPSDATADIFFQSSPSSSGNSVIGNYLKGGAYSLYNENSVGLTVEDNTFAGATYGDCDRYAAASWGTWSGNKKPGGSPVTLDGDGCN